MSQGGTEAPDRRAPETVVLDTCVLLNFIVVGRTDLLGKLPLDFLIPSEVWKEVRQPAAAAILARAMSRRIVEIALLNDGREMELLEELLGFDKIDEGEAAAMAMAICRSHSFATDDKHARNEFRRLSSLRVYSTQDLMALSIEQGLLDVETADRILQEWRDKRSFALKIRSFADLGL